MTWAASLRNVVLRGGTIELLETIEAERSNLLVAAEFAVEDGRASAVVDAFVALVPSLELVMWAPMATSAFALFDRLESHAAPEDRWRVLMIRHRVTVLRGDFAGEFELLAAMEQAASEVGQPFGSASARCTTLAIIASAGADVLDELIEAVKEVGELDVDWGSYYTLQLAFVAAYRGNLKVVDALLAGIDRERVGTIHALAFDVSRAIVMWSRGEATAALPVLAASSISRSCNRSVINLAIGFRALADVDLGNGVSETFEQDARRSADVEGNAMGLLIADWFLSARLLEADDVQGANIAYGRALAGSMAIGLVDFGPNERYTLVAAGVDDYRDEIATVGGPVTTSANRRAQAERRLRSGDTSEALTLAHEALTIALEQDAFRSMVFTLECIGRILTAAGHENAAGRLFGACGAFRSERSLVLYPCLQRLLDDAHATCRANLGDDAYATAVAEGATLTLAEAADYARRVRATHTSTRVGWDALTPTEARVAELVAEGLTNPQVAKELLMGAETVKTHLSRVFAKVGVANRKELIIAAGRRAAERHR
jgi:DNA-binding CsgD family transcriptional regulator